MAEIDLRKVRNDFERDGFVSGIDVISSEDAARHRDAMEAAETAFGNVHYETKVHTILRSPFELATLQSVLDVVEQLIGFNILL